MLGMMFTLLFGVSEYFGSEPATWCIVVVWAFDSFETEPLQTDPCSFLLKSPSKTDPGEAGLLPPQRPAPQPAGLQRQCFLVLLIVP